MLYLGFESFELILVLDLIGLWVVCESDMFITTRFFLWFRRVAAQVRDLFPEPGH
jgi:hypothetical protein